MYKRQVHARSDLTSVQKLHYLYSSFKNEPLDLIKALPICHENYSIALSLLSNRYDNKFILAKYYIQNLLEVKSTTKDSVQSLAEFINTITSSVNSLTAMKLSVDSFELIVVQLLSTKLDHSTFKLWKESENLPNFQGFYTVTKSP